jgi:hypothetical protein
MLDEGIDLDFQKPNDQFELRRQRDGQVMLIPRNPCK